MGTLKTLGLAGVASVVALAFVGTGSASALSALCTQFPETKGGTHLACEAGTLWEKAIVRFESEGNAVVATSIGNVECPKYLLETDTVQAAGKASGQAAAVAPVECISKIMGCQKVLSVGTANPFAVEVEYLQTAAPQANFIFFTPTTTIKLECGAATVTCVYAGNPGEKVIGGYENSEKLIINSAVKHVGPGGFCPEKATLLATMVVKTTKGKVGGIEVKEESLYAAKE